MKSKRTLQYFEERRWDFSSPPDLSKPDNVYTYSHDYTQDLVISKNNGFKRDRRSSTGAVGGDFLCYRRFYKDSNTLGGNDRIPFSYWDPPEIKPNRPYYEQPVFANFINIRNGHFPLPLPSDRSFLNSLATEAISKIAPNKPEASLSSFLGELREGLPRAVLLGKTGRARTGRVRNAGDEYLNVEFGWKPLVRDVQSFATSVRNSEEILKKFEDGAGKLSRRTHTFPTELVVGDEIVINPITTLMPPVHGLHYGPEPGGALTKQTTSRTERWFAASFMYAIPPRGTPQNYSAKANKLLGTNLSPEMLWNIAPWSWAADWAGNAGTIATNLSLFNSDCLVMPWNYIMERKTIVDTYTWRSFSDKCYRNYPGRHSASQELTTVMKYRQSGTPYGFHVDWPDFTAAQLAILASLGMSRAG